MKDEKKTKAVLIAELRELRQQLPSSSPIAPQSDLNLQLTETDADLYKSKSQLLKTQTTILQMTALGNMLPEVLEKLCLLIEAQSPNGLCSILFFDEKNNQLRSGVAPNLPPDYADALDCLMVGEGQGSCGTAVARQEQVIVHDIAKDPLWEKFSGLALKHNIQSCWSTPFFSRAGKVLGTFAISHNKPCSPTDFQLQLIETATHLAGIAMDSYQVTKALKKSEERFKFLAENMADIVWTSNLDFNTTYTSPSIGKVLGFTPEERVKQNFSEMVTPKSLQFIMEKLRSELLIEADPKSDPTRSLTIELEYYHAEGHTIWMESIIRGLRDKAGKLVGIYGASREITKRKAAEKALKKSEEKNRQFATIVDQTSESIMITNKAGNILYVNPAFERLSGYSAQEVLNKNPKFLKSKQTEESLYKNLWETILNGKIWSGTLVNKTKSGSIYHEKQIIFPVKNKQGQILDFCKMGHDISGELELDRQQRQSQKLETIGKLAGTIAHDFNNFLTPILGYTDLALTSLSSRDTLFQNIEFALKSVNEPNKLFDQLSNFKRSLFNDLQQVLNGAHRAKDLVHQILIFSREQELDREPLYLHQIITEALKLMTPAIPASIKIQTNIDANCGKALVAPTQMHQVISNLCTNAFQAMENGGVLNITLAQVIIDAKTAKIFSAHRNNQFALLTISDTGSGMTEATLDRLFEPFFTTKAANKGTGLGLSVVHGIIRSHDGEIIVKSELGRGTVFQVYLPIFKGESLSIKKQIQTIPIGIETVLVVDDETIVVNVVKKMLEKLGYTVQAENGSMEALKTFRETPNKFDIVITDFSMPDLTGLELAKEITQTRSEIPIVLMTGYGENLEPDLEKTYGIQAVLGKPITLEELAKLMRKVIDR